MSREQRWAIAGLIVANVLWGAQFAAAKYALDGLSPPLVAVLRVAPGVPFMFAFMLWRRMSFRLSVRDAGAYLLLGFFGFAGAKYLQYAGLAKSTAVDGALLVSFEAILTMLAAVVFLREALTGRRLISVLIGFAGVCVLSRIKPWEGLGALADQQALGNAIMVLSLCCEAAYTVWGARLMRNHDPYRAMTWSLFFGTILLLPSTFGASTAEHFSSGGPMLNELWAAPPGVWAAGLFLGLGPTALAYTIWLVAARYLDAGNMAITLYVQPLSGTVFAILVLAEPLDASTVLGGGLLLLAVHVAARGQTARTAPVVEPVPS